MSFRNAFLKLADGRTKERDDEHERRRQRRINIGLQGTKRIVAHSKRRRYQDLLRLTPH